MDTAETVVLVVALILLTVALFYLMYWLSKRLKISFLIVFIITLFTGGLGLIVLTVMALLPEKDEPKKVSNTKKTKK